MYRIRFFSLVLFLTMGLVICGAGTASAVTTNSAQWVPNVSPPAGEVQLGTLRLLETGFGSIKENDSVSISLPSYAGIKEFRVLLSGSMTMPATKVTVSDDKFKVGAQDYDFGAVAPLSADLHVSVLNKNTVNLIVKRAWNPGGSTSSLTMMILWDKVDIGPVSAEGLESSDIRATLDAPSFSGFSSGTVAVGRILTAGGSSASAASPVNITDAGGNVADITIKEDVVKSLKKNDGEFPRGKTVKLILSPGFKWDAANILHQGGFSSNSVTSAVFTEADGRSALYLKIENESADRPGQLVIKGRVSADRPFATERDVKVFYGGTNPGVGGDKIADMTVARYRVAGLAAAAKGELDVVAGRENQQIGNFTVAEGMQGDLQQGRTIRLTLPAGVKWSRVPDVVREAGDGDISRSPSVLDDGRTLSFRVDKAGTSRTVFRFNYPTVSLAINAPKKIEVAVKGPGISGAVSVANVQEPLKISAGGGNVRIGAVEQPVGDLVVQENLAGALRAVTAAGGRAELKITLPAGVSFAKMPSVAVSDGDLELDKGAIRLEDRDRTLVIPVSLSSSTPVEKPLPAGDGKEGSVINELIGSTVEIREILLTLSRAVPEGDITVEVSGSALSETGGLFSSALNSLSTTLARCVTPKPAEIKVGAVFTIGSKKYLAGAEEKEMDIAPYIKDGRTYAPVRYIAYAAGVPDDCILWDGQNNTVTILAGKRVIQFEVGKNGYLLQGSYISTDAAPENIGGRVTLPYRFVAQALGLKADWNAGTQQVVIR